MISCPSCSNSNEDHYKFCLACGTELSAQSAKPTPTEPKPEAKTAERNPPEERPRLSGLQERLKAIKEYRESQAPRVVAPETDGPTSTGWTAPPSKAPGPLGSLSGSFSTLASDDTPEPVADGDDEPNLNSTSEGLLKSAVEQPSSDLRTRATIETDGEPSVGPSLSHMMAKTETEQNPEAEKDSTGNDDFSTTVEPVPEVLTQSNGVASKSESDQPSAHGHDDSDDLMADEGGQDVQEPALNHCPACGADVPPAFKFCGACGHSMNAVEVEPKTESIGELILIHPDGSEGEHFDLGDGNLVLGRDHDNPLFSGDPYLSPKHVRFEYQDGWFTVVDLHSFNGVYIRLRAEVRLDHGDFFRIGQQLLRFENARGVVDAARPDRDGTMAGGSPSSGIWGRISQAHTVDSSLGEWTLTTPEIYLGRERGTITFPADLFVSASHCRLRRGDGVAYLSDLGSTNGSYARIKDQTALSTGDLILLGQQLFRVELS